MTLTPSQEKALKRAANILEKLVRKSDVLSSPQHVRSFLQCRIGALESETFTVIFLDNRNGVIAVEDMFTGTIDCCPIFPREVVKAALKHNAAALILAYNHPSFVTEPSDTDARITRRLIGVDRGFGNYRTLSPSKRP